MWIRQEKGKRGLQHKNKVVALNSNIEIEKWINIVKVYVSTTSYVIYIWHIKKKETIRLKGKD